MPFEERLLVGLSVGYYSQSSVEAERGTGQPIEIDVDSAPVVFQVTYELPFGIVVPYAGVGAGVIVNRTSLSGDLVGSESVALRPAVAVLGGLTFPLRSGATLLGGIMAQAQYAYAKVNNDTVVGRLGGLDVTGGYQYEF
jgi:hypothetical protein